MKALTILAFGFLVFIHGCQRPTDIQLSRTAPAVEEVHIGKPVHFTVKETFPLLCTGQTPFSIRQVTENGSRILQLEHSCIGVIGSGMDEYCEQGKIVPVYSGECSDAISCVENYSVNYEFNWDQQEYVLVTEECGGTTIHREIKQQVPAGRYQVIVNHKIIKDFTIIPTDHQP